ncbi:MAG: ATP-dependent Clp protease ATP-binding subunit ClpC [Acidobacteriota bacterium]|jgi:ATP-dependent Clp protease ATP-binding subunit ClpA|nr:ATP-dependent Clp protease ATP-binding subunit ClpC [Acidobacteriota bacterium]
MLELEHNLEQRLKQKRVRIDVPDSNTLFLRNVPANTGCFNKSRTNLLIKRPHAGQPFIVCVDEDLEYTGNDSAMLRAFTAAHRQAGWRVIYLEKGEASDSDTLVENALRVLGFDGNEPVIGTAIVESEVTSGERAGLLASFGTDITGQLEDETADLTIARDDKIEEVVASIMQWQSRLVVITGQSGVGKSNLLYGVARRLRDRESTARVITIDLGVLMAGTLFDSERESLLAALFEETLRSPDTVLGLEHLELAIGGLPHGQWLLGKALDQGIKIIGTVLDASLFDVPSLARRIQFVELTEPWPEEAVSMLMGLRGTIAAHHRVTVDESIVRAAVENAQWLAGCLPARAISLLDMAAARASLTGSAEVCLSHIYLGCSMLEQSGSK